MSLASLLPKPKNEIQPKKVESSEPSRKPRESVEVPPYGCRAGFQLSGDDEADFPNDSGAYPEIHTLQYPFGMGRRRNMGGDISLVASSTITRQYDAQGNLQYDLLAKMGHSEGRIIQASLSDMLPASSGDGIVWSKPPAEEIARQTEATRAALEKIINGRIKATQPKHLKVANTSASNADFIRFTPADTAINGGSTQKIIRMTEAQKDPFDPPKFSHKRIPKPPPSPPAPVLHSPPRKVSADEQAAWKVPPCISNWKNSKGYTIPLDKRLAADGRGLLEYGINENFASFAESLYLAEQHARTEVEKRSTVEQKIASAKKAQAEENLRLLAQQARAEKSLIAQRLQEELQSETSRNLPITGSGLTLQEREAIRRENEKEIQKDLRLSRMGPEQKAKYLARDADRDISEKIALGVASGASMAAGNDDSMYDQRLFDQTSGISTGFGEDDDYSLYSKPLFGHGASGSHLIYKPNIGNYEEEGGEGREDASGTRPSKGFQGATGSTRTGPVEFEPAPSADPFGLDQMLHEAKLGAKRNAPSNDN